MLTKRSSAAYSLSISSLYFISSLLRVLTPEENSKFRRSLIILASWTQWLFLPALLIWSLNRFSVDSEQKGGWAARAFGVQRAPEILRDGFKEWLFGREGVLEDLTIGGWDRFLRWSSPIFQLCEGFCSLLVIQATGQVSKYLVNKGRSDTWLVSMDPS